MDDIIFTTFSYVIRKSIISLLSLKFAMKNLGSLSYFLGIVVTGHVSGLFLSQQKYATEVIEWTDMSSCKVSSTPVDMKPKFNANSSTSYANPFHYRSLAKPFQYLSPSRDPILFMLYNRYVYSCMTRVCGYKTLWLIRVLHIISIDMWGQCLYSIFQIGWPWTIIFGANLTMIQVRFFLKHEGWCWPQLFFTFQLLVAN